MTTPSSSRRQSAPIIQDQVREFIGHEIVCLHAIDQPLVSQMQKVIVFLHDQQMEQGKSLWWVLRRIKEEPCLCNLIGPGTESYERLTQLYADLTIQNVDTVREKVCPGSAALHHNGEETA